NGKTFDEINVRGSIKELEVSLI
ncbi:type VI secretion ATPase, ClpV1 family, partial [Vibrio parahaemolyticus EKP-026]